jgi:hypothetical protein
MADESTPHRPPVRDRAWLIVVEFAIVACLFVADIYHHIFFSKTPYLFLLGWTSLRLRGLRWKDVGFTKPRHWGSVLVVGVLAGLCIEGFELFVSQPVLARLIGKMPDLSDFTSVKGQLGLTAIYLLLAWVLAAFGEELVYRGYLMNRIAGLFLGTRAGWITSLIATSLLFGCAHIGQGLTGIVENMWDGLVLGTLYLVSGRNLAVPIIAHGVMDTGDIVLMYLGKYPGIR